MHESARHENSIKQISRMSNHSLKFPVASSLLRISLTAISVNIGSHFANASSTGGMISGTVFQDSNHNGVMNTGELGLQGWSVTLTGGLADHTIVGPITVTTNTTGGYSFSTLGSRTYNLTETIVSGWGPTSNPAISNVLIGIYSNKIANFGVNSLFQTIHESYYSRIDPEELMLDSSGNLYDPQTLDGNIKKFDTNGNLKAIIGSQGLGYGQLYRLSGVAVDSNGIPWIRMMDVGYTDPQHLGYLKNYADIQKQIDSAIVNKSWLVMHFHDIINGTFSSYKKFQEPTQFSTFKQTIDCLKILSDKGILRVETEPQALHIVNM